MMKPLSGLKHKKYNKDEVLEEDLIINFID